MCGIAGAFDLKGRREFPASRLLAMTGAILHRGPDDEHIHIEPGVALGARRLSIVDLSGARRPPPPPPARPPPPPPKRGAARSGSPRTASSSSTPSSRRSSPLAAIPS